MTASNIDKGAYKKNSWANIIRRTISLRYNQVTVGKMTTFLLIKNPQIFWRNISRVLELKKINFKKV